MMNSNFEYFLKIAKKKFLILFSSLLIGLMLGYFLYNSSYEEHEYKISIYPILNTENMFRAFNHSEILLYDYVRILKEDINDNEQNLTVEKLNNHKEIRKNLVFLKERIDYEINTFHISFIKKYKKNNKDKSKLIQNDIKNFNEILLNANEILGTKLLKNIENSPKYFFFGKEDPYGDFYSYLNRKMSSTSKEFNEKIVNGKDSIIVQNEMKEISLMKACIDIFSNEYETHLNKDYINKVKFLLSNNKDKIYLIRGIDSEKNLTHNIVSKNIYIYLFFPSFALFLISLSIILLIDIRKNKIKI